MEAYTATTTLHLLHSYRFCAVGRSRKSRLKLEVEVEVIRLNSTSADTNFWIWTFHYCSSGLIFESYFPEMAYRVAAASEYLVITGLGIKDVKLQKKGWILPGQNCSRFDISPTNYTFDVHAMSSEKLPFILPAVFTIGPKDEPESLLKFGKLMSSHDKSGNHVVELVKGIVEGETRVLAAGMTMEQIFRGTKEFKAEVFDKVRSLQNCTISSLSRN